MQASKKVTVIGENGLHARPAMSFVDAANRFTSGVRVTRLSPGPEGEGPETVDGKSIMQMLTLAAVQGTELLLEAEGDDAEAAVRELARMFEEGFEE